MVENTQVYTLTLIIQQHILWFKVSVDDPLLVEVLQALDDLSSIVTGPRLFKPRVVLIHIINVIPSGKRGRTFCSKYDNSSIITCLCKN